MFRSLFACCCGASAEQAQQYNLLQALQSEDSLIRERDKLIKEHKYAERTLVYAKKSYTTVKSRDFRAQAKARIYFARQKCCDAHTTLENFNKQHPELPPAVQTKK